MGGQRGMESNKERISSSLCIIYIIYMFVYIKIWKSHTLKSTITQSFISYTCGIIGGEQINKKPNATLSEN